MHVLMSLLCICRAPTLYSPALWTIPSPEMKSRSYLRDRGRQRETKTCRRMQRETETGSACMRCMQHLHDVISVVVQCRVVYAHCPSCAQAFRKVDKRFSTLCTCLRSVLSTQVYLMSLCVPWYILGVCCYKEQVCMLD